MRKSGRQAAKSPSQARISGVSALRKSRFRFRLRAVTRQPISWGPFWLMRPHREKRSWPSTLKMGMKSRVTPSR